MRTTMAQISLRGAVGIFVNGANFTVCFQSFYGKRFFLDVSLLIFQELGKMENVLKDLEKIRIQNIMQQTRLFIQSMLNQQAQSRRLAMFSCFILVIKKR